MTEHIRASASLPERHPLYAPGLRRRARKDSEARYWLPLQSDIKNGYPLKCLTIPASATELECAELCRKHWADLTAWRGGHEGPTRYSIAWLIKRYTSDEWSPYRRLRYNTAKNYYLDLSAIEKTIGQRRVDPEHGAPRVTGEDVWRWYRNWGRPDGDGNLTVPSRARHLITMLRSLIKYGKVIGVPGCAELAGILRDMEFPTGQPRTIAPKREQVIDFVQQAAAMGYSSVAITTLAQFELIERRISIIGTWEGAQWRPGWVWQNISPDWIIRYSQNKVGTVVREFDLKDIPPLLALLQQTPEERRVGPVIICETTGQPWQKKHYTDTWREIARAAGLPDNIWSMDMRAGGATEADATEVSDRALKDAGGWQSDVFNRYRRDKQRNAGNVVRLRQSAVITHLSPEPMMPDLSKFSGNSGVYFLQCQGGDRHIKIGFTTDLKKRLRQIVTGCPYPVDLIGVHPGPLALERFLHYAFSDHRATGEWFRPAPEILDAARDLSTLSRREQKMIENIRSSAGSGTQWNELS